VIKLFATCAAAIVILFPTMGTADGFYVSGHTGAVFLNESDNAFRAGKVLVDYDNDTGYGIGVALGYDFTGELRLEWEIGYRKNDAGSVDVSEFGVPSDLEGSGSMSAVTSFANVTVDLETDLPVTPYIGFGIGGALIIANNVGLATPPPSGFGGPLTDDEDLVFAYQAIFGIDLDVTERITLTLDYRYFRTLDAKLDIHPATSTGQLNGEYRSHNALFGARFGF
jgi:opacity protein-like surface antigen